MSRPPVIESTQLRHALKVAAVTGHAKERDAALLMVAYSTGLMPNEFAKFTVADYLAADGTPRVNSSAGRDRFQWKA